MPTKKRYPELFTSFSRDRSPFFTSGGHEKKMISRSTGLGRNRGKGHEEDKWHGNKRSSLWENDDHGRWSCYFYGLFHFCSCYLPTTVFSLEVKVHEDQEAGNITCTWFHLKKVWWVPWGQVDKWRMSCQVVFRWKKEKKSNVCMTDGIIVLRLKWKLSLDGEEWRRRDRLISNSIMIIDFFQVY